MPLLRGRIELATVTISSGSEGTSEVQPSHRLTAVFDDPNVMSAAGLVPVLRLAEGAGLTELLAGQLTVPSPNAAAKGTAVVAGMLAGADSIDDLGLLRHGAMGRVFSGVRAPSTLGSYLRAFTHGLSSSLHGQAPPRARY
jgi:hypothetical protein